MHAGRLIDGWLGAATAVDLSCNTVRIDRSLYLCRFFKNRVKASAAEAQACHVEDEAVVREHAA